jgi:ElaB/YqjD/DUF883 family membrane-anchored ribosome-binding protein
MPTTEDSVKIAVLEQKLFEVTNNISKLNDAIEKISEANTNLIKMLAVHEQKIEQGEKTDTIIMKMMEDFNRSISDEYKRIQDRIDDVEKESRGTYNKLERRLDDIIKVKWMTVGIASALVVLTGLLSPVVSTWVEKNVVSHGEPLPTQIEPNR